MCGSEQRGTDRKTENFFNTAEDSDDEEGHAVQTTALQTESAAPQIRLPNPLSATTQPPEDDDEHRTSVFTNYFHKAEEAKLSVLEHHVKLTTEQVKTNKEQTKHRNKTGVCINFQRGRCRFGTKCRFSHSISSEANEPGMVASFEMPSSAPKFGLLPSARMPLFLKPDDEEDESDMQKKRKHRSGVTDSLVPPKRALKSLDQQRKEERPWTVSQ